MNDRNGLIEGLNHYSFGYEKENSFKEKFLKLLEHPRAFFRDHLPGHITGSAWIIDEPRQHAFLTHHAKLNRWLQPGGHADGEENVFQVALREAIEETGLKSLKPFSTSIFDIDIHTIPARQDFPEHDHYDIRFLFTASLNEKFTISEESNDLAWIPLDKIDSYANDSESILRMAKKVLSL
jgi:8-oxo-dGTP pyrophosphatase MutT (NUDIX family)